MPFLVFSCLNHRWGHEKDEPAAYAPTRRELALVRAGLNGPGGKTYNPPTPHRPENFSPTAAAQVNFETREPNAIGSRRINSRTKRSNGRYDRSVCANYAFATQ